MKLPFNVERALQAWRATTAKRTSMTYDAHVNRGVVLEEAGPPRRKVTVVGGANDSLGELVVAALNRWEQGNFDKESNV